MTGAPNQQPPLVFGVIVDGITDAAVSDDRSDTADNRTTRSRQHDGDFDE